MTQIYQSQAINILVYESVLNGESYLQDLTARGTWGHQSRAMGGYWSGTFSKNSNKKEAEEWIENGLDRTIIVYSSSGVIVWDGFVNKITVQIGDISYSIGPITEIANQVSITYKILDTSYNPPREGANTISAAVDNTSSQAIYGIWPKVLNGGTTTTVDAEQGRDTYLQLHSFPLVDPPPFSPSDQITLNIECLGHVHKLLYPYTQEINSGTTDASQKIEDILAADPNSIISTDYGLISTNTLQVNEFEDKRINAIDLINSVVNLGDSSDNRWTWGVFADKEVQYNITPSDLKYVKHISDPSSIIYDISGSIIRPHEIVPGNWISYQDMFPGRSPADTLIEDIRASFIESVSFRSPDFVSIEGTRTGTLKQRLNRLGLGSI